MSLQLLEKKQPFDFKPSSKSGQDLLEYMDRCIAEASDWCEPEHSRAEENASYERGFQWKAADAARQEQRERPALPLNNLVKVINAVANREIMDRYVPKVFGRASEDWGVAEVLDETCKWQRDWAETDHEESMAFRKSCASGYGVMHKYWDESAMDGLGKICDEELPIWQMLWDPRARKQNLVDRRYHVSGKYVPIDEVLEVYGTNRGIKQKLKNFRDGNRQPSASTSGGRWGWREVSGRRWWHSAKDETFVIEFEWLSREQVWKAAVPVRLNEWMAFVSSPEGQIAYGYDEQSQQPQVMDAATFSQLDEPSKQQFAMSVLYETELVVFDKKKEFDAINDAVSAFTGEDVVSITSIKEVCNFAIRTSDIILKQGIRPMGFTYEFLTGLPFEMMNGMRFYGMVDIGKGPQDFKNVFYSNALATYMTSPKNQLLVEEGLVENPSGFLNDYAKLGGVMFVPDGFVQSFDSRVKQLDAPAFPQMLKELISVVESALEDLFGLSSIEMGSQGDLRRVSGTTSAQARQASSTILAVFFDGLKRYRKRFGMLNVRFIQAAYEPTELVKIVGEEVAQGLAGIEAWPEVNRIDIKIDEAPTSISEQMQTADFLTRTGTLEKWVDSGKMAFEDAIDLLVTLPKSTREKIKKNSQYMKQVQGQMEQLQQQIEQMQQRQKMMDEFILTVDRGGAFKAQFNTVFMLAQEMAGRMMQEQQANQGPAQQ